MVQIGPGRRPRRIGTCFSRWRCPSSSSLCLRFTLRSHALLFRRSIASICTLTANGFITSTYHICQHMPPALLPLSRRPPLSLLDSVSIECWSSEHFAIIRTAWIAVVLYPLGLLVVSLLLLLYARDAILNHTPTSLSRAIAFLHQEFEPHCFYWECCEV